MARAVLITFRDNDAAEAFVKKVWEVQDQDSSTGRATIEAGLLVAAKGKIEWMIARPLNSCYCRISPKRIKKGKFDQSYEPYHRTQRFGWFVHSKCNKPNRFVVRNFINNLHVGWNDLLDELREPKSEVEQEALPRPPYEEIVHVSSSML
jgi:hypothetical protein